MPKLSDLAKSYLEHFDAIDAGWRALNADLPQVMAAARDQLAARGEPVSGGATWIERTWPSDATGLPFTLRFHWGAGDPLKTFFTLNQLNGRDEVPEPLRHLIDAGLLASWRGELPSVEFATLVESPVAGIVAAWDLAIGTVEAARASEELASRMAAFALLTAISNAMGAATDRLAAHRAQLNRRPGDVAGEPGWPAHVQVDWLHQEHQYAWNLVYVPEGPRLWLVLYDGRNLRRELPLATPVRYQDRFPILADFSLHLAEDPLEAAAVIADRWLQLVETVAA
jgi:hypothetical protein